MQGKVNANNCISEDFGSFHMSFIYIALSMLTPTAVVNNSNLTFDPGLAHAHSVLSTAHEERGRMSARGSPQEWEGDSEQTQPALLERILENQDTIRTRSLSDKLMPLLVGNLQRLAEANNPSLAFHSPMGSVVSSSCPPLQLLESPDRGGL